MKSKTSKEPNSSRKEHEQLGRMLQNIYETGYMDRNQAYKMSFLKGVVTGFGGVIGATIVVGLVLWILSLLNYTPLKPLSEKIQETVQTQQ